MIIQDLGRDLDFHETWKRQEELVARRHAGEIEDTILLLEHAPVYTIGRTRDQSSLGSLNQLPHPVVEINRGGQATYHGPGQLTGYVILDLNQHGRDLHAHLRRLEDLLIRTCAEFDIHSGRRDGLTGVWVGERKLASLGVGVRKWISLHGFAINVTAESLSGFEFITPCGLSGVHMTHVQAESSTSITMADFKATLSRYAMEVLDPVKKTK